MKNGRKITIAAFIAICMVGIAVPHIAQADSSDITVEWIVPADTTIAVSFPTGETNVQFDATSVGMTFTNLSATGQDGTTAALKITNNGNTPVSINASFTAAYPTGIDNVNLSLASDDNTTSWTYASGSEQTNQTITSSNIADGGSEEWWAWSSGTDVAETASVTRTLRVWSVNE